MSVGDFAGKVALVTGGARGIGRAIVQAFAEAGADVALADIRQEDAEATAREIREATGRRLLAVPMDVTALESVQRGCERVLREFGQIDVLVNNAGWDRIVPFLQTTPELWEKIIAINYRGVIHTCYTVLPHMVARRQGSIVNISSDAARVGSLGEAVYAGAKAAVIAFSKTLAREHARDQIRVNVVCPGPTETPLVEEMQQEEFARKILGAMAGYISLKRLGRPEDVAPVVVFLASEAARYITGQVISVSGGLTMVG
jgi:2-hydroxycyclohexanecarboxyl-CoA dehydrogenase